MTTKKIITMLMGCMAAFTFVACNSDDEPARLTPAEIAQRYDVIKGVHDGMMVYALSGEGTSNYKTDTLDVKIDMYSDSAFVIKNIPPKAFTVNLPDGDLKTAMVNAQPVDLECVYGFMPSTQIQFLLNPSTMEYHLTYGDKPHKVRVAFYINNYSSYGLWDSRKNLMYMQMVVAGVFEDDSNTNKLSKNQVGLMFYTKKK